MPDVTLVLHHAYGRSGDKLNRANVGLVCRSDEDYALLAKFLTADRVRQYLQQFLGDVPVRRYLLPSVCGLNFVIENALDGGSLSSRRIDRLAKALSGIVLSMPMPEAADMVTPVPAVT